MSGTGTVSHGRGGQGNIGPDPTIYTDGGIHREGDPAAYGAAYSAGRGGAGNMGSPRQEAVGTGADDDIVPDAARLNSRPDEPHHTGRGGGGNVTAPENMTKPHEGFVGRIKKFFGTKKK